VVPSAASASVSQVWTEVLTEPERASLSAAAAAVRTDHSVVSCVVYVVVVGLEGRGRRKEAAEAAVV
jgi:hypothetical protein